MKILSYQYSFRFMIWLGFFYPVVVKNLTSYCKGLSGQILNLDNYNLYEAPH